MLGDEILLQGKEDGWMDRPLFDFGPILSIPLIVCFPAAVCRAFYRSSLPFVNAAPPLSFAQSIPKRGEDSWFSVMGVEVFTSK